MAWETLLAGATDVESLSGVRIADWSGVLASGPLDGDPWEVAGRRGASFTSGELKPYTFAVPFIVTGADTGAVHTAISSLRALFWGTVTLTRRVSYAGAVQRSQTARVVALDGWDVQMVGTDSARVSVALMNLDGCWYEASAVSLSGSGSLTVPGDTPTANATITLGAGVKVALAGSWVQNNGTSTATVDGLTWGVSGVSAGKISHAGAVMPLLFLPGANTVTVTGGTGSVAVKGAWR